MSELKKMAVLLLAALLLAGATGCAKTADSTVSDLSGTSSEESVAVPESAVSNVLESTDPSVPVSSQEKMAAAAVEPTEDEKGYVQTLLLSMPYAYFTDSETLDDSSCMQLIESIINYQEAAGTHVILNVSPDTTGVVTVPFAEVQRICRLLFNKVLVSGGTWQSGDNCLFYIASGLMPQLSETEYRPAAGGYLTVSYRIQATGTDSAAVYDKKMAATFRRTDDSSIPFRIVSVLTAQS